MARCDRGTWQYGVTYKSGLRVTGEGSTKGSMYVKIVLKCGDPEPLLRGLRGNIDSDSKLKTFSPGARFHNVQGTATAGNHMTTVIVKKLLIA